MIDAGRDLIGCKNELPDLSAFGRFECVRVTQYRVCVRRYYSRVRFF